MANDKAFKVKNDLDVGGDVIVAGNLTVEGSTISLDNATVQTFTWGDNDKAVFGDGSDLQIYHDGTTSKIDGNVSFTNNVTLSGGTANGVTYLNGSKVLTSGSALTFDGSTLGVTRASAGTAASFAAGGHTLKIYGDSTSVAVGAGGSLAYGTTATFYDPTNFVQVYTINGTEAMRLTSTGLGVETSSPAAKLHVSGSFGSQFRLQEAGGTYFDIAAGGRFDLKNAAGTTIVSIAQSGSPVGTQLNLDSSGNLGLGVTPSAWSGFGKTMEFNNAGCYVGNSGATSMQVGANNYFNGSNYIYSTSNVATRYVQVSGQHIWFTAPAGTAGNAISFTQAMALTANSNLTLGVTSELIDSGRRLSVVGGSVAGSFKVASASNIVVEMWNAATSGDNIFSEFKTEASPTYRGAITYNRVAGLVTYNTTSDYRAKDIYGNVTDSGAVIDSVPVYMGKMKGATQERPMFIAHETPSYAHTGEKDAVDDDGNPIYQQMDSSALVPVMWAELQSLRKRVAALEAK